MNGLVKIILGMVLVALPWQALPQDKLDQNKYFIGPHQPTELTFYIVGKGPILTIGVDGVISTGSGYTPTEAGDAFIKALQPQLKALCK